ncbi:MAG TPA: hypothetical protein PKL48_04535, partial [Thermodesulfobacteriota bacterium]|nr:hypothetical protein [Thermodesulfobacteriota bacterium]
QDICAYNQEILRPATIGTQDDIHLSRQLIGQDLEWDVESGQNPPRPPFPKRSESRGGRDHATAFDPEPCGIALSFHRRLFSTASDFNNNIVSFVSV